MDWLIGFLRRACSGVFSLQVEEVRMWQWMNGNSWAGELYLQLVCVCAQCVCERFRRSSNQSSLSGHSAEITTVLAASATGLFSLAVPEHFSNLFFLLFLSFWILTHSIYLVDFFIIVTHRLLQQKEGVRETRKGAGQIDDLDTPETGNSSSSDIPICLKDFLVPDLCPCFGKYFNIGSSCKPQALPTFATWN